MRVTDFLGWVPVGDSGGCQSLNLLIIKHDQYITGTLSPQEPRISRDHAHALTQDRGIAGSREGGERVPGCQWTENLNKCVTFGLSPTLCSLPVGASPPKGARR